MRKSKLIQSIFRWLQLPMVVWWVWAASVQTNDPDPILWISIYGLAALFSLLGFFRWGGAIPALCLFFVAAIGSLYLSFGVIGQQHLFNSEEGREMMGLAIVSSWMLGVVWLQRDVSR